MKRKKQKRSSREPLRNLRRKRGKGKSMRRRRSPRKSLSKLLKRDVASWKKSRMSKMNSKQESMRRSSKGNEKSVRIGNPRLTKR